MSMLKEFKEFAMRGNVIDMAVGVVIGAAFGKIVVSLVSDVVMPPIGVLLGKVDFSGLTIPLIHGTENAPGVAIKYGVFLNTVIEFLIVALAIFVVVKAINTLRRSGPQPDPTPPAPTKDQILLTEIRDLLKARA